MASEARVLSGHSKGEEEGRSYLKPLPHLISPSGLRPPSNPTSLSLSLLRYKSGDCPGRPFAHTITPFFSAVEAKIASKEAGEVGRGRSVDGRSDGIDGCAHVLLFLLRL